jgi:hypothetical protein
MQIPPARLSVAGWWTAGLVTVLALIIIAAMSYTAARSHGDPQAGLIPSGWETMAPCRPPADAIDVTDLSTSDVVRGCNAEGVMIRFPGGNVEAVPEVGVSGAHVVNGVRYTVDNWGTLGVAAITSSDGGGYQFWGTSPQAVQRQIRWEAVELRTADARASG